MYKSLYIILFLFAASGVQAQQLPERSLVRKGNRQYNKGNYEQSAGRYEQALQAAPGQFEAIYNLGNALYKAERFDRAEQTMQRAAADSLRADTERAEAFYNLGNAQFKQQKYQEALESYKQSLRLNPSDMEAKYNYAYTKRLLDENKDGGGGGGNTGSAKYSGWPELVPEDKSNSDYYYAYHLCPDFPATGTKARNFSTCYSKSYRCPVWVAAPLHDCYTGDVKRTDAYRNDPDINCTQAGHWSGYTRGHMLGSNEGRVTKNVNRDVFYYSNIGPQLQTYFNTSGGQWNTAEDWVDKQWRILAIRWWEPIGRIPPRLWMVRPFRRITTSCCSKPRKALVISGW